MLDLFKALLIGTVILLLAQYAIIQRSTFHRGLGFAITLLISLFIANPSLATLTANWFGIGRGADFILYLTQCLWALVLLRLYQREKLHAQEITELTRQISYLTAREGKDS